MESVPGWCNIVMRMETKKMNYEYICAGNLILDSRGMRREGPGGEEFPGGPATFAYTGIRIWTDRVMQVSRTGREYEKVCQPWIDANHVETKGIRVVSDRCNHLYGFAHAYGMAPVPKFDRYTLDAWQDFGYQKIRPEDIGEFTRDGGIRGVYLASNPDTVFWDALGRIRQRDGFKLMWEIEGVWARPDFLQEIRYAAERSDIFSINLQEAQCLFECSSDGDCIQGLRNLPVEMTLFRVGERGLYVVTKDEVIYLPPAPGPVVDTVGCGNSSTGSALYAFAEGKDPLMVGIMANIASARNLMQYGVIPEFSSIRQECWKLAEELYQRYSEQK